MLNDVVIMLAGKVVEHVILDSAAALIAVGPS